jgi:hypothetical protein
MAKGKKLRGKTAEPSSTVDEGSAVISEDE